MPWHILPLKWLFVYSRIRLWFLRKFVWRPQIAWVGVMGSEVLWGAKEGRTIIVGSRDAQDDDRS